MKSILLISTEFPPTPGGIGSHAFALANELSKRGWKVAVASDQNNITDEEAAAFNNSQLFKVVRLMPIPSVPLLLKKLWNLCRLALSSNSDIIIGTGKHGSWFAFAVAKLLFKKSVMIGHGTEFTVTMSDRSKFLNKICYSKSDLLVCVSNYTKMVAEQEQIKNKNTAVIHNGADDDVFYKISEQEINLFRNKHDIHGQKIIVTIGNVSDRKGQEWVIRAMPEILKSIPNAHYYCLGVPTVGEKLKEISEELGVDKHVHLLGRRDWDELRGWLNAGHVFAMTSTHVNGDFEGFGISVIEAALCGKCAVVTNQSGLAEAIVEGETGLGAPEKDSPAIAKAMIRLLGDDTLRGKMDAAAYKRATQDYTWKVQIGKYEKLFNNL